MKKFTKGLCLLLVLALGIFALVGCGQGSKPADEPEKQPEQQQPEKQPEKEPEMPKVALLLPGPVSDGGWNAIAYDGLKLIGENYGVEIAYAEYVATSDMEEMFRNYANQGFGVIFGHGFEFNDPALKVAENFPDVKFVVTSSDITNGSNLASIKVDTGEQGFLAGATSALLSESNKVAVLGGMEIPPIVSFVGGFEAGAKYAKPDVNVMTGFTGSMEDAAKMKEMMTTFIQGGADAGTANGDQAGLGGLEALKDANKIAVGVNYDQSEIAPQNVPLSIGQSYPMAMSYLYKEILEGNYVSQAYLMGVKAGAVEIMYNAAYNMPADAKAKLEEIVKDIADGKIDVESLIK